MGFMDKAKEAALQAKAQAQAAAEKGQAKVGAFQQQRADADVFRALGEAYFKEQRRGGSHDDVVSALAAVEAQLAADAADSSGTAAPTAAPQGFTPPPTFNQPPTFTPPTQ